MTLSSLADVLLGLLLIAWICYRQLTWRPAEARRMLKLPLILGVVGIVMLATGGHAAQLTPLAVLLLLVEVVLSVGVGVAMGAVARFRPARDRSAGSAAATGASRRGDGRETASAEYETRTGWVGVALWAVLVAVRVGMIVLALALGIGAAEQPGVILVMLAANRAARAATVGLRVARLPRRERIPAGV